tara:strand:- start:56027 stop:56749 length:723 start_codon:yes stop_codon:yes gene_type:complete
MRDTPSIVSGLAFTLLLHIFVVGLASTTTDGAGCGSGEASGSTDFAQAETIEASLAFKEVKPKNKQPQKKKKQKFKPNQEDGASKNEKLDPEKKPKKETVPVDKDEIDIASILDKNRKQDEDLSDTGSEETPVEGSPDGSEWGTEKEARGDPYVGELKGRIYDAWKVPALETGTGSALGCVRLDKEGAIVDRELKKRSKNTNLDRSVEVALKDAPAMDKPVPDALVNLLTVKGICFNFAL